MIWPGQCCMFDIQLHLALSLTTTVEPPLQWPLNLLSPRWLLQRGSTVGKLILWNTQWELLVFFFLLTGCDKYLNLHPILSYDTNPRQQPVDLITASSVSLSDTQATSCAFNQKYFVHDYSGFQSRWTNISNGFFNLTMTSGNGQFNLNVRAADCQWFYRNIKYQGSQK